MHEVAKVQGGLRLRNRRSNIQAGYEGGALPELLKSGVWRGLFQAPRHLVLRAGFGIRFRFRYLALLRLTRENVAHQV